MGHRSVWGITLATILAAPAPYDPTAEKLDLTCTAVSGFQWSGFRVHDASEVSQADGVPAHCRISGTIDDEIRFELLLPAHQDWNGRFLMGGGGGFVGAVTNQALDLSDGPHPLARGFATAGTDTGHEGTSPIDATWARRLLYWPPGISW